jgi:adenylosuccinate synthase
MGYLSIFTTLISTAGAIGVAYIGAHQRKDKKINDLRQEGNLVQMEMIQANLNLAQVTAKAVMNQEVNGDLEEALDWAKKVNIKYSEYLRRVSQSVY